MLHFFDWFGQHALAASPWLILGKGPSYSELDRHDVRGYRTLALNHVVRERAVDVAHIIDVDVVAACGEALLRHAGVLVMPWHPHVNHAPTRRTLADFCADHAALAELDRAGRLLWYNAQTGRSAGHRGDAPEVPVERFSVEAAFNLLAMGGARTVRTLGIDGGNRYSERFSDLSRTTLLANQQVSFDCQFRGIADTLLRYPVDFAPLGVPSPVRVFVGSEEPQMLAVKVLEFSIRRHASIAVDVVPLHRAGVTFRTPRDARNAPRTPFSFQRFAIPQLAGGRGRAIYLDSDMLVFRDIKELWTLPFGEADLLAASEPAGTGRKPQFSVMLLDCERLEWSPDAVVDALDSGRLTYEQLMFDMALARRVEPAIDPAWNSLERFEPDRTRLLHYTDMDRQPWLSLANPLGHLWVAALQDAVDEGFISRREVRDHVDRGWVRPSLLRQLDRRRPRTTWLDRLRARRRDRRFVPPHLAARRADGGQR